MSKSMRCSETCPNPKGPCASEAHWDTEDYAQALSQAREEIEKHDRDHVRIESELVLERNALRAELLQTREEIEKWKYQWASERKISDSNYENRKIAEAKLSKLSCPICGSDVDGNNWKARAEKLERVTEYAEHRDNCIRGHSEAGEPTEGGGYRVKYSGRWYQTRPIDETPKCDCGLDAAIRETEGE